MSIRSSHCTITAASCTSSVRNVPAVHVLAADQLNTYDVVIADQVVFTKAALETFLAGRVARSAAAEQTKEASE